ncbi:DUF2690 domain-containing protein [Streptomyces sp. NPDC051896]|uniref:DUF2690 domain-containing protein n=1 Tax=Streptomyces sp. NPDC051896 TaxID=3155416 RepID=UPI003412FAB2
MLTPPAARRCSSSASPTTNTTSEASQKTRYSATCPMAWAKRKSWAAVTRFDTPAKLPPASVKAK